MGIMGVKWRVSSISIVAQFFDYTIYLKRTTIHLSDLASSQFKSVRIPISKGKCHALERPMSSSASLFAFWGSAESVKGSPVWIQNDP